MPMRAGAYPAKWREMSRAARDRAGDRCEECGVANGAVGARDKNGDWHDEDDIHGMNYDVGYGLFRGEFPRMGRIVLTCHHPDGDTENPDARLEVLCQKDHLAKDLPRHVANAAATRRRKRIAAGQAEFGEGAA